jgi:hypothetical protein
MQRGLVRYWWVLVKLVLTTGALALLILHTRVVDTAADHLGWDTAGGMDDMHLQLIFDAPGALGVLMVTTLLSVVKPPGRTPFRGVLRRPTPRASVMSDR